MEYALLSQQGTQLENVHLRDDVFGLVPNAAVVHQALLRHLANARQGTHDTKTRGEVRGSTKKLFRQKGTGRARQGGSRAPHRRGGGVAFGPHPRSHRQGMPNKMRRLAIRSVLSAKAQERELVLLDALQFAEAKTKAMIKTLQDVGVAGPTLVVTERPDHGVILSARNVPGVYTLPAAQLNVATMLSYRYLVMTIDAARRAEQLWGLPTAQAGPQEEEPREGS